MSESNSSLDDIFSLAGELLKQCTDLLKAAKDLQKAVEEKIKKHGGFDGSAGDAEWDTTKGEMEVTE